MSLSQKLITQRFIDIHVKPNVVGSVDCGLFKAYSCDLYTVFEWFDGSIEFFGVYAYQIRDKYNIFTKQEREPF